MGGCDVEKQSLVFPEDRMLNRTAYLNGFNLQSKTNTILFLWCTNGFSWGLQLFLIFLWKGHTRDVCSEPMPVSHYKEGDIRYKKVASQPMVALPCFSIKSG